jgi:hypothetical protein
MAAVVETLHATSPGKNRRHVADSPTRHLIALHLRDMRVAGAPKKVLGRKIAQNSRAWGSASDVYIVHCDEKLQ